MRLIDAEKLKEEAKKLDSYAWSDFGCIVDEAPTIEAEPVRHGRWYHDCEGYARCSICNEHEPNGAAIFYTFCPNCGAKMDGEDEE